MDINLVK